MNECTLLLISQDSQLVDGVVRIAREIGNLEVAVVGSLEQAYVYPSWDKVALALIHHDRRSTTMGVIRLLRMLAAARRSVATVVLGDDTDTEEATELLRRGAADLLLRPFDMSRLMYLTDVLTLRMRKPVVTLAAPRVVKEKDGSVPAWDEDDPMIAQARRIAPLDTTVLIQGEAGTGKSRLARILHEMSPRKSGPFVTIRCSSLSADGLAQELFGREMDASNGLGSGRLAEARTGTLLLDDVDTLSPRSQAALVDWIERESHRPSMGGDNRPVRPRLLATARGSLADTVTEGRFRSDLFYRLNVVGLSITPLRQRRTEIADVVNALMAELSSGAVTIAPDALQALESYNWMGNVRELRDVLESALSQCRSETLGRELLPEAIRAASLLAKSQTGAADEAAKLAETTLAQTKREAEFARITQALEKHGHNRLRTASELGISRMTLYKKLYKYGIIEQEGRAGVLPSGRPRRMPAPNVISIPEEDLSHQF